LTRESRLIIILVVLSIVAVMAVVFVYRGKNTIEAGSESKPRIAVILKTVDYKNLAFWQTVKDGIESAAKDFNVEISIQGPMSETQVDEQITIIKNALKTKPDAFVIAAADFDRLIPVAKEIKAANIPLVTIDSFINGDMADTKIGTDNYDAGQKAGAALMEIIPSGSKVVIMSYVQGTSSAIDRESGVRDFLNGRVDLEETIFSGGEIDVAYKQASYILDSDPEVRGIIALNDPTTIGAARALSESNRKQDVVLIGFDNSLTVLGFVEAEVVKDTIVQKPFNMGYLGIKTALDLIQGKKADPFIDTGSKVINRQNMLLPENQKLLFPVSR
jgi:ribose transport system substrate-binding protein